MTTTSTSRLMHPLLVAVRSVGILVALAILGAAINLYYRSFGGMLSSGDQRLQSAGWKVLLTSYLPPAAACLAVLIPFSRFRSSQSWWTALILLVGLFSYWITGMFFEHSSPFELTIVLALFLSQLLAIVSERPKRTLA